MTASLCSICPFSPRIPAEPRSSLFLKQPASFAWWKVSCYTIHCPRKSMEGGWRGGGWYFVTWYKAGARSSVLRTPLAHLTLVGLVGGIIGQMPCSLGSSIGLGLEILPHPISPLSRISIWRDRLSLSSGEGVNYSAIRALCPSAQGQYS